MQSFQNSGGRGQAAWLLRRCRRLPLTHRSQSLLDPAREFLLPSELNLRVLLSHTHCAMAGDLGCLDARPARLLALRYIGTPERVWTETGEIAAFGSRRLLQGLDGLRNPRAGTRCRSSGQTQLSGCAFSVAAFTR